MTGAAETRGLPEIIQASAPSEIEAARRLIKAYADWLAVDLCFQNFEAELRGLPGDYAPPEGRLLLARGAGQPVGCVALRRLEPGVSEMKRLWVEPFAKGRGIGRLLVNHLLEDARAIGYRTMRLDTMPERLPVAQHIYRTLGFREIPFYYHNPLPGVVMMELDLD